MSAGPATYPERLAVAVPCGCALGEAPVWDARLGALLWTDIKAGALWQWRPDEDPHTARALPVGDGLSFVRPTADPDRPVVGLKSGIGRLSVSSGALEMLLRPEPDLPGNRLNDADTLPDGALLFGSMDDGEREPSGHFYHWSGSRLRRFGESAVVTNGPTVDPERGLVYTADTRAGRVDRHRFGPDGVFADPEPFVRFGPGEGHPDGLTVDAEGHVWICHFGAGRITRFAPDGRPVLLVPVPTAKVTKLAFGGPDLATAYVTTAATGQDAETDPLAGHLFRFDPGVRGLPSLLCAAGEGTVDGQE